MSRFFSEALAKQHDRKGFASGSDPIDKYFRERISQDVKRDYARAFVLIEKDTGLIAGFYTLSAHSIVLSDLAAEVTAKLPRYPSVPAVLLGWMGRDERFRGQGIGALLLADAAHRIANSAVGAHALCADAIDAPAADFYRIHGFAPISTAQPMRFFISLINLAAALAAAKQQGD